MLALSLWQPWASLVVSGAKKCETRSWPTAERGRILVHAARRWDADLAALVERDEFQRATFGAVLPLGCVIGSVEIVDCLPVAAVCGLDEAPAPHHRLAVGPSERAFGDYSAGRYVWLLANPVAFRVPFAHPGAQRLFNVPLSALPVECRTQSSEPAD